VRCTLSARDCQRGNARSITVLTCSFVMSGNGTGALIQRVLLLGPDDEARRALHLMLDRAGKQVAAVSELAAAMRVLADGEHDAVIAAAELAPELVREGA